MWNLIRMIINDGFHRNKYTFIIYGWLYIVKAKMLENAYLYEICLNNIQPAFLFLCHCTLMNFGGFGDYHLLLINMDKVMGNLTKKCLEISSKRYGCH